MTDLAPYHPPLDKSVSLDPSTMEVVMRYHRPDGSVVSEVRVADRVFHDQMFRLELGGIKPWWVK